MPLTLRTLRILAAVFAAGALASATTQAFAASVTKQKNCAVLIDGLEGSKGDKITLVASDGSKHKAVVTGKKTAKVAKKSCKVDLKGAEVEGGGGSGGGTASSGGGGGSGKNRILVGGEVGYTSLSVLNTADPNAVEQPLAGFDFGAFGAYSLGISKLITIPFGLGAGYVTSSGELVKEDSQAGASVTFTFTMGSMYLRMFTGAYFNLNLGGSTLPIGILPFFDYGISGSFSCAAGDAPAAYASEVAKWEFDGTVSGLMRYGAAVSAEYIIAKSFRLGGAFRYFMGSFTADLEGTSSENDLSGWTVSGTVGMEF